MTSSFAQEFAIRSMISSSNELFIIPTNVLIRLFHNGIDDGLNLNQIKTRLINLIDEIDSIAKLRQFSEEDLSRMLFDEYEEGELEESYGL